MLGFPDELDVKYNPSSSNVVGCRLRAVSVAVFAAFAATDCDIEAADALPSAFVSAFAQLEQLAISRLRSRRCPCAQTRSP